MLLRFFWLFWILPSLFSLTSTANKIADAYPVFLTLLSLIHVNGKPMAYLVPCSFTIFWLCFSLVCNLQQFGVSFLRIEWLRLCLWWSFRIITILLLLLLLQSIFAFNFPRYSSLYSVHFGLFLSISTYNSPTRFRLIFLSGCISKDFGPNFFWVFLTLQIQNWVSSYGTSHASVLSFLPKARK